MAGVSKTILEGLERAIEAEIEGYHFYTMAAEATSDPKGKEVFAALARDEQGHAEYLRRQYASLSSTGKVDAEASYQGMEPLSGPSPIFSDSIKARIGQAHFEMTALSIGIQLEADAQRFYKEQADLAEDPEVTRFYRDLARWEAGHYHALLSQQEALKEAYWAENRFSPF